MRSMLGVFALALALWLLPAGCTPSATTIDAQITTNDPNTTGGTNDPNTTGGPSESLSDEEKALAQMLARKQIRLMKALGAFAYLARQGAIPTSNGIFQTGTCPQILGERQGDAVAVELDYGAGCSATQYAPGTFSGKVTVVIDLGKGSITALYEALTADGDPISGFIGPATWSANDGTAVLQGPVNLDDKDTNSTAEVAIVGTVTVTFDSAAGAITVSQGDVQLTEHLDAVGAALANVVGNSQQNGNFTPQSGTVTSTAQNGSSSVAVTFGQASPTQGTASASVDGGSAVNFNLE